MSYEADIDRARRLIPLVEEGFAASLTEAATRFALSHPAMGTILVGMATPDQFRQYSGGLLAIGVVAAAIGTVDAVRARDSELDDGVVKSRPTRERSMCRPR